MDTKTFITMAKIVMNYVKPFMAPFDIIVNNGHKTYYGITCQKIILTKMFKEYIETFGYDADYIVDKLRKSTDAYIAGSFVLDYLTQTSTDRNWKANDIDLFTSDETFMNDEFKTEMLSNSEIVDFIEKQKIRHGVISETNDEILYTSHFRAQMKDLKQFYNKKTEKELQVIYVKNAKKSIENFDFDIVKVAFDGEKFIIFNNAIDAIKNKFGYMKCAYGEKYMFDRAITRATKYKKRGYTILFPTQVMIMGIASTTYSSASWEENVNKLYKTELHDYQKTNYIYTKERPYQKVELPLNFGIIHMKDDIKKIISHYETKFMP